MLIMIKFRFFVCVVPTFFYFSDLYELVVCNKVGSLGHNCAITKVPVINMITRMSHLLVCFNSSANFLIYYLNGEKFRRAWVETYGNRFCCCRTRVRSPMRVTMHSMRTDLPPIHSGLTISTSIGEKPGM